DSHVPVYNIFICLLFHPYFSSSLPFVIQIRGHITGHSSPLPTTVHAFVFTAGKAQPFLSSATREYVRRRFLAANFCTRKPTPRAEPGNIQMEMGRRWTTDRRPVYVPWRRNLRRLLLGHTHRK
ncbi:unnamed protein product, partial [Laminaria digitata]